MSAIFKLTSFANQYNYLRPGSLNKIVRCCLHAKESTNNDNSTENDNKVDLNDAEQFVAALTVEHRQSILVEIQKLESAEMRQRAEGELPRPSYIIIY